MHSRSILKTTLVALVFFRGAPWSAHYPTCSKMTNYRTAHATASGFRLIYDEFNYPAESTLVESIPSSIDANKSGIVICYSGLTQGFNGDGGAAKNHIDYFIQPLSHVVGFQNITVAFALNEKEALTNKTLTMFHLSTVVDRIAVVTVPVDTRRKLLHPQYLGIEACGRLISQEEEQRGEAFAFSVRMRYDLKFTNNLQPWAKRKNNSSKIHSFSELLPEWPIWKPNSQIDVTLFQKHTKLRTDNIQRCLPQDVFFVAKAAPVPSPIGLSAAWPFQGNHPRRNYVSGDNRDHFEATLLGPAFDRRARIAVLFNCGGTNCWELNRTKRAIFPHTNTTPHSHPAWAHTKAAPVKKPQTAKMMTTPPAKKTPDKKSPHAPQSLPNSGRKSSSSSSGHRSLLRAVVEKASSLGPKKQ